MDREKRKIKGILFNSARVLNESSTGHWFISPNFFKYVFFEDALKVIPELKSKYKQLRTVKDTKILSEI